MTPADFVLMNGKIITVDDRQPDVQALAAYGDRITAVGSDSEIKAHIGSKTEVLNLDGKVAIPGFTEGHAHLVLLGQSLQTFNVELEAIILGVFSNHVCFEQGGDVRV